MNITYRKPRRRSILGSRLSILRDNIPLQEDIQSVRKNIEADDTRTNFERRITRSTFERKDIFINLERSNTNKNLERRETRENLERSDVIVNLEPDDASTTAERNDTCKNSLSSENEPLNQVLGSIEFLLEKNSQTLKTLMQEREQLEKIERLIKEKINSTKNELIIGKENQPPNQNTPTTKKDRNEINTDNQSAELISSKLSLIRETDKSDDEFAVPHDPTIEEMRSSFKCLKTPRPSRQTRKSILLTPHSFSFSLHKQFQSLKQ